MPSSVSYGSYLLRPQFAASAWKRNLRRVSTYLLALHCVQSDRFLVLFFSIGTCRMRRFLAVLRSFLHFSPLCTFSCHPYPPTILPSFLTSTYHLFLGKAVPLQAWSGPEDSRKLRFPDFMTTAQEGGKFVNLTHRPHLPPGNSPGTHFC